MLKRTFFLLILLIFIHNLAVANSQPKTFLWKIEKDNKTLYILGSIHIASTDMYPLDTVIVNNFNRSDVLGVEIDLSKLGEKMGTVGIFENMIDMSGNGETLKILPPDLVDKIAKTTVKIINSIIGDDIPIDDNQKEDIDIDTDLSDDINDNNISMFGNIMGSMTNETVKMYIGMIKPWGIALILQSLKLMYGINDMKPANDINLTQGIDQYFINLAQDDNKPIIEMEGLDRQIEVFKSIQDSNLIADYLYELVKDIDENRNIDNNEFKNLLNAWKSGDDKILDELLSKSFDSPNTKLNAFMQEQLMYKRNREMATKVEELIKSNKTHFIVVGAGHLIGKESIIDILSKTKKYKIQRY